MPTETRDLDVEKTIVRLTTTTKLDVAPSWDPTTDCANLGVSHRPIAPGQKMAATTLSKIVYYKYWGHGLPNLATTVDNDTGNATANFYSREYNTEIPTLNLPNKCCSPFQVTHRARGIDNNAFAIQVDPVQCTFPRHGKSRAHFAIHNRNPEV